MWLRVRIWLHRSNIANAEKVRYRFPAISFLSILTSRLSNDTIARFFFLGYILITSVTYQFTTLHFVYVSFCRRKLLATAEYIYKTLFQEEKGSDITVVILGKAWRLHKVYISQVWLIPTCALLQWSPLIQDFNVDSLMTLWYEYLLNQHSSISSATF